MQVGRILTTICVLACCSQIVLAESPQQQESTIKLVNHAFDSGEKLTYDISWSKILVAGVAIMEVQEGPITNGRPTYRFVISTQSAGMVERIFPIRHFVESVSDANDLYSNSFNLREDLNGKLRKREITFDHKANTARFVLNYDTPEIYKVPERVHDALSVLYYVRATQDFRADKPIIVNVFDSDKTWSVEIYTLGKERISTPIGEFDTIKVKTYPKYEGVFMNKGEIFIWLTDDERKIPVLMQSTIMIGSIVSTLIKMEKGKIRHDVKEQTQTAQ